MRQLIIDRFEGKFAICEDEMQRFFAIEVGDLPKEAKAGSVLEIDEDGGIAVNEEETQRRRARILEKQNRLLR